MWCISRCAHQPFVWSDCAFINNLKFNSKFVVNFCYKLNYFTNDGNDIHVRVALWNHLIRLCYHIYWFICRLCSSYLSLICSFFLRFKGREDKWCLQVNGSNHFRRGLNFMLLRRFLNFLQRCDAKLIWYFVHNNNYNFLFYSNYKFS